MCVVCTTLAGLSFLYLRMGLAKLKVWKVKLTIWRLERKIERNRVHSGRS
jgi:hypothetical protein